MSKNNQNILLFFLILFSLYCAISIGQSWDEGHELYKGKVTLDYLLSLGEIDTKKYYREYYSTIYWSLLYLLTKIFPANYQIEASHIINFFFSLSVIFGISKLSKELFNNKVAKITFLILFFYPIFFGHMAMNNKDVVLALCHVWITYLVFRYFKNQKNSGKNNKYIFFIGLLAATGTGIQLVFLGSLLPLFTFIILEIFLIKKIVNKNFDKKKFLLDLIKCFIIFYLLLIFFWIDTYPNILILPFKFFTQTLTDSFLTGWPFNLVNGNYYFSAEVPKSYIFINLIYKSPEYFLISYLIFILLIIQDKTFFIKKFKFFNYKLILLSTFLIFPSLVLYLVPYPVYDGLRLFLWSLPYYCILPAITIYYLIENLKYRSSKIYLIVLSIFALFFLFNFFSITPYQYTYLNSLNGNIDNRYKKFENDYWGASIEELIDHSNLKKNENILISTCGVSLSRSKKYLKKIGFSNVKFVRDSEADYVIMTNRAVLSDDSQSLINCFDKFKGEEFTKVTRNGVILSIIKKTN